MLEQKDFVNVEGSYKYSLQKIKSQLKRDKISNELAKQQAEKLLSDLERKLHILELLLSEEDLKKINNLITTYENFISTLTPLGSNI